jgi:hypothetical protein
VTKANLVVEKAFINVQCKSKEGEQTSPQGNRGMAVAETPNQTGNNRREMKGRILIIHHFDPEARQSFRPGVLTI